MDYDFLIVGKRRHPFMGGISNPDEYRKNMGKKELSENRKSKKDMAECEEQPPSQKRSEPDNIGRG